MIDWLYILACLKNLVSIVGLVAVGVINYSMWRGSLRSANCQLDKEREFNKWLVHMLQSTAIMGAFIRGERPIVEDEELQKMIDKQLTDLNLKTIRTKSAVN